MVKGNFGVAIFPPKKDSVAIDHYPKTFIDHFAFRVSPEDFKLAQEYFHQIGLPFDFQDHTYFHSIYVSDPDGHKVELTTPVDPKFL